MPVDARQVRSIFLRAVEEHRADDRSAFLDAMCEGDAPLRDRVEALLRAHGQSNSLLDHAAMLLPETIAGSPFEDPGTIVGPYRLMEQIGEGGMGLVFVAEQQRPLRRKVALKVIKPGIDTREVIARFEAERQALALMDHPHIARVFDAGATAAGRPFFVMELVRGAPITTYCDNEELPTNERLKLFVSVCRAVQHAHQKGVIHRDIKPSNVLVTLHDGEPVVKVIDFGVAKAINQRLTEKTVYTAFQQMLGTPLYMSPEQADLSGLDIDTRTDIYSLGVLLYELLTGTTPFERERLRGPNLDELRRILREEEPPKPSTRISTLGQAAATVSARRRSDPQRLKQLFRRELDWIAMKALEKDRDRRYETAAAFANDVEHHLSNEPVLACPPAAIYRFRKFARRNKRALIAAAALVAALSTAMGLLTLSNLRLRAEQERTAEEYRRAEAMKAAADKHRAEAQNRLKLVLDALDEIFVKQAETLSSLRQQSPAATFDPRRAQAEREFLERGLHYYEQLAERPGTRPEARLDVGRALRSIGMIQHRLGHFEESLRAARRAARLFDTLVAEIPNDLKYRLEQAESYQCLYWPLTDAGEWAETDKNLQATANLFEKLDSELQDEPRVLRGVAECYDHLVLIRTRLQRAADATRYFDLAKKAYARLAARFPQETEYRAFPNALRVQLAICLHASAQARDAAAIFGEAAVEYEKLIADVAAAETTTGALPTTKEQAAWFRHELGFACVWQGRVLYESGRLPEAEAALRHGLDSHERLVAEFPTVADYRLRLSWNRWRLGLVKTASGDRAEAERLYREAIVVLQQAEIDGEELALAYEALAELYDQDGRAAEAIEAGRQAVEAWTKLAATNDAGRRWQLAGGYDLLGAVLKRAGRLDESQGAYQKGGEVWGKLVVDVPGWADYQLHFLWNRQAAAELYKARGDLPAAEKTYREAIAVLNNTEVLDEQPALYDALSDLYGGAGKLTEAIDARRQSVEAWTKLADKTGNRNDRSSLALATAWLSEYLKQAGRLDEAEDACRRCNEHYAELSADGPLTSSEIVHRIYNDIRLGKLRNTRGDAAGAERALLDAVEHVEQVRPGDLVAGAAYEALATWYAQNGRLAEAITARQKQAAASDIRAENTGDRLHRQYIVDDNEKLAALLGQADRAEEAEAAYRKAQEVLEKLAADFPDDTSYLSRLAGHRIRMGDDCKARDDRAAAETCYREAAALLEQTTISDVRLGRAYHCLSKLYEEDSRTDEAIEARQKSLAACMKLANKTNVRDHRWHVGDGGDLLAALFKKAGRFAEAEAAYRDAAEVWRKLAADFPKEAHDRSRLAWSDQALSKLLARQGRHAEAIELARDAVALREKLVAETNHDRDHRRHLALACQDLAAVMRQADHVDDAEAIYRQAGKVWDCLVSECPDAGDYRFHLALNERALGELLAEKGGLTEAVELEQSAVAHWQKLLLTRDDRYDAWNLSFDCQRLAERLAQAEAAGLITAVERQAKFQQAMTGWEEVLRRKPNDAPLLNGLAWLLATCSVPDVREPTRAVEFAKKAVELKPEMANCWNTLGVAQYRAGDWSAAIEALTRSTSLGNAGAAAFDWYFLAMAHWQLGNKEESHKWYDQAVQWTKQRPSSNEELRRFHTEAEALLGARASGEANRTAASEGKASAP